MKNRIAVFTNGFGNEFVEHVVEGLRRKAKADGIDIFVFVTYCSLLDHELQNKCQLNIFHLPDPDDFDGAIMLTNTYNFPDEHERVCARFQRAGVPMLSLEVDIPNMSCIKTENYKGVRDLALHLVEHHKFTKIMYINGVAGNAENAARRQALIDVLAEHGLELAGEMEGDFSFYSAYMRMNAYLDANKELPDAFVCANDEMALGVSSSVFEHGFSIPEDVAVTGFDMIKNGQHTIPILATVSRGWDTFGEKAYDKLMYQIAHPDERFTEVYDSFFVPSESCGCEATKEATDARYSRIRNLVFDNLQKSIMDIYFQRLQVPLSTAEHKEDFFEIGTKTARDIPQLGPNYCICTESEFFELDDDNYPERIRGYSSHMDVIYELRNGEKHSLSHFSARNLYPGYEHVEGKSNLYIFAPLNYLNFIIGYIAIKNSPTLLYNLQLSTWIRSMNALLFNMRRYIFSQRDNQELKRIYMTDALTGIYNRTGCEKILYKYILTQKENNCASILVFADIDRMKTINDVYGHLNGDLAIKATAEAFVAFSPDNWHFGRYGGDEFIAVGPCPDPDQIEAFIHSLSESMSDRFKSLNLAFMLHASIGYTVIEPRDNGTIEDYISRADRSMYSEKEKIHKLMDSMNFKTE
ncbi:MAG: GGDEF domain-containing protein [Lachnospiraceae bacterium]|nr:GGDEF domain-containing protein [Lachnospiraceae bacterium]